MNWIKKGAAWVLTVSILVSTTPAVGGRAALDPSGCFYTSAPNCTADPKMLVDSSIDANLVCLVLETQYLRSDNIKYDLSRHQQALNKIDGRSDLCFVAEQVYHECFWCKAADGPTPKSYCQFESCAKPTNFNLTDGQVNDTCSTLQALYDAGLFPASIDLCDRAEQSSWACPVYCNQAYLGADTTAKKKALPWISRASAFLSFLGAAFIIHDVATHPKYRGTAYHQLLFAMAWFDVATAFAWGWATWPIPKDNFWIYGASGTAATCTAQAFFVQLGFTSVFYNVSLAIYYLLVIVYDWREHRLQKIRIYLHGIPLTLGVVLACAGIPFYDWFEYGCHFLPPPQGPMWSVLVFAVAPLCLSIASITTLMMIVYLRVRRQARSSRKWRLGTGSTNTLEKEVFWQSFWYLLAFYATWPILFSVYLASVDVNGPYAVAVTLSFVAPLQGWNNFLVYTRPRYNRYIKSLKNQRMQNRIKSQSTLSEVSLWRRGLLATTRGLSDTIISVASSRYLHPPGASERGPSRTNVPIDLEQYPQFPVSELTVTSGFEHSMAETAEGADVAFDDDEIDPSVAIAMEHRPGSDEPTGTTEPQAIRIPETIQEGQEGNESEMVESIK